MNTGKTLFAQLMDLLPYNGGRSIFMLKHSQILKKAYETGDYTMQQIADALGVHYSTVSSALHKTSLKNA